ncbi:MAG TPA: TULIP family P47-like protein, partial [Mycobacteriales bacterium]|nr:TULIP family P47-like protein [Mycobacteriales bacterium]
MRTFHVRFPEHVLGLPEPSLGTSALTASPAPLLKGTAPTALAATAQPAHTNEWDTVFAIRFSDVNAALQKPDTHPAKFVTSVEGASAIGDFGAWQVSGGSGVLLHMKVPITMGTTIYEGKHYPMDGAVATIEVRLKFLPQPSQGNGTPNDLTVRTTAVGDDKVVAVTDFEVSPDPGAIVTAVMGVLLEQWLNDNLQQFHHVFSTVDLGMRADMEQFAWLKPTSVSYGVHGSDDNPKDSIFGVLCMTEKRIAPDNHDISPEAIPSGARSGFLISGERFLEKLIMPGLPSIFPKATLDDFEITNDGTQIRNKKTLAMNDVDIAGISHTPTIAPNNCTVSLDVTEVVFKLQQVHVEFSPGIDIYMYYTGYSSIELVTQSDGKKALNYLKSREPVVDHSVDVASWVVWTEVAASVAAAVVTLGVGAWAKKVIESVALRAVATVITLLVTGLIANIGGILQAIAAGEKDKLPSVDLVMTN